jgi:Holliday junction DNA helicase RuvA
MIGWLQGHLAEPWRQANRFGVLLVCHGVGYEVQLCQRHWQRLPEPGSELVLHVHHSIREDGASLYGFQAREERDLFRELVAVSGVGPQAALALLGTLEPGDLVRAIVQADLRLLTRAPGVGRRTAERLAIELRERVLERFGGLTGAGPGPAAPPEPAPAAGGAPPDEGEEVRATLAALGFELLEIQRALRAVAAEMAAGENAEAWIGACLRWLSRTAA